MPRPATASPPEPPRALHPDLQRTILGWYAVQGRELVFRATSDPYAILVSEAMAQQTQARRAGVYWERFMLEFPSVGALAAATPAAVIRAWRGLGYNRRALALRRAAIAIVEEYGGHVPDDIAALQRLPGVGPYTARAVAALAFGRPVGAVDVNVRRVLSRVVGGRLDALTGAELQATADASVPVDAPGPWTHALMDIGARFCLPRRPGCAACPAAGGCQFALNAVNEQAAPAGPIARSLPAARERAAPFETTSRWIRGRLLDLLRDAPADDWVAIPALIGQHDRAAIERALVAMARDGLVERAVGRPDMARLPID
ncbi:MAG: A/G-specific adenine glycosylase [Chloroflexota bacterium]